MDLIKHKSTVNNPEWHGYFLCISRYTGMDEIEYSARQYWSDHKCDESIELRIYNETSSFKSFIPDEKNHIGFIRVSLGEEDNLDCQHLTSDRKLINYKEWDACEFYSGR